MINLTGFIFSKYSFSKPYQTPLDTGLQVYGTFNFLGNSLKPEDDSTVVKFLKNSGYWKSNFKFLDINTPAFKDEWKILGTTDLLFGAAQYQFAMSTRFYPLTRYVEQRGLLRSKAVDEALFSLAMQHDGARKICDRVISTLDLALATEKEIIHKLYQARREYLLEKNDLSQDEHNQLNKRYDDEEQASIALVKKPLSASSTFESIFVEQLGFSLDDANKITKVVKTENMFTIKELASALEDIPSLFQENYFPYSSANDTLDDNEAHEEMLLMSSMFKVALSEPTPEEKEKEKEKLKTIVKEKQEFYDVQNKKPRDIGEKLIEAGKKRANSDVGDILTMGGTLIQSTLVIGEAAGTISALISSGASFGAMAIPMVGQIYAIGSAVYGMYQVFKGLGSKKAADANLQLMQYISRQISELRAFVAEQFNELFQQTQAILDGINTLLLTVDAQVGGLRMEIAERLDSISSAIIFLNNNIGIAIQDLALQPLRDYYDSVESLIESKNPYILGEDPAVAIPQLESKLFSWCARESAHGLYNGSNLFRDAPPPDVAIGMEKSPLDLLINMLNKEDDNLGTPINSFIAYLARYYQSYQDPTLREISISQMPNPKLWNDIAQKFLAVKSEFMEYDKDQGDYMLGEILESGDVFIQFINMMENDTHFWSTLRDHYNELVGNLISCQYDYINIYSASIVKKLRHPGPSEWNFLQEPEHFFSLMDAGWLMAEKETSTQQVSTEASSPKERYLNFIKRETLKSNNLMPLIRAIQALPAITQPLLAAEYLGIINIQARQITDEQPHCVNPITGSDFIEVDTKLHQRGGRQDWRRYVIGKGGMEVLRKAPNSNEKVTEWTMLIEFSIMINQPQPYRNIPIMRFDFHGSYAQFGTVETIFYVRARDGAELEKIVGGPEEDGESPSYYYCGENMLGWRAPTSYGDSAGNTTALSRQLAARHDDRWYGHDIMEKIPEYIDNNWSESDRPWSSEIANPDMVTFNNEQVLISGADQTYISELVEAHFLQHRKVAARVLNAPTFNLPQGTQDSALSQQQCYMTYRETLTKLDIHVRLIQLFCYLAGKDFNVELFHRLTTSMNVHKQWQNYEENADIHTSFIQGTYLGEDDLGRVPDLNEVKMQQISHPRVLFKEVKMACEAYRNAYSIHNLLTKQNFLQTASARMDTVSSSSSSAAIQANQKETSIPSNQDSQWSPSMFRTEIHKKPGNEKTLENKKSF